MINVVPQALGKEVALKPTICRMIRCSLKLARQRELVSEEPEILDWDATGGKIRKKNRN